MKLEYVTPIMEDEHIYKSHNKCLPLYNLILPAKYRRKIFTVDTEIEWIKAYKSTDITKN